MKSYVCVSDCMKRCGVLLGGLRSPLILALGAKITQIAIYLFGQPKPMQGIAYISGHIPPPPSESHAFHVLH